MVVAEGWTQKIMVERVTTALNAMSRQLQPCLEAARVSTLPILIDKVAIAAASVGTHIEPLINLKS